MPFIISDSRRGGRVLAITIAITLGLAALIATPARAANNVANPYNCTPQATLSQPFAAWNDYSSYTPVPNAGFENGSTGWTMSGGAAVMDEPWQIGSTWNARSLDLPAGSSAVTAPICIDQTYPDYRLFARSTGNHKSPLKIEVLFYDKHGNLLSTAPYQYTTTSNAWQPTGTGEISLFTPKTTVTAAPVAFRFTPLGHGAHYQIDDVYVDPWARR